MVFSVVIYWADSGDSSHGYRGNYGGISGYKL
jgi:hypothetical protein